METFVTADYFRAPYLAERSRIWLGQTFRYARNSWLPARSLRIILACGIGTAAAISPLETEDKCYNPSLSKEKPTSVAPAPSNIGRHRCPFYSRLSQSRPAVGLPATGGEHAPLHRGDKSPDRKPKKREASLTVLA